MSNLNYKLEYEELKKEFEKERDKWIEERERMSRILNKFGVFSW